MHIPDLVLSGPVALATGAIGLAGAAVALRRVRHQLGDRTTVLMGMMAAFVFAAQMVNFPILVLPASGHLIGGALAAVLLGPWAASLVLGIVLLVQCLLFGDGALTALGANYLNLGLIATLGAWLVYDPVRRAIGGRTGVLVGAMVAAWLSVPLSAVAFSVELAASGRWSDFPRILGWMSLVHTGIGVGEALITGAVVRFVLLVRPDLIFDPKTVKAPRGRLRGAILGGLAAALGVAAFLSPLASDKADGLEFVGGHLGFIGEESPPAILPAPIPDYELPGVPGGALATAGAGLIGTLVVFGAAIAMGRSFNSKGHEPLSPTWRGPAPSHLHEQAEAHAANA